MIGRNRIFYTNHRYLKNDKKGVEELNFHAL